MYKNRELVLGGQTVRCTGGLVVEKGFELGNTITMSGVSSENVNAGNLTVTGNTNVNSITVDDGLTVNGDATIDGTMTVDNIQINNAIIQPTLNIEMNDLTVDNLNADEITCNGTIRGTSIEAGGNPPLFKYDNATGKTGAFFLNANTVEATSFWASESDVTTTTISGFTGITTSKEVTVNDDMNVSGATSTGSLSVTGNASVSGDLTLSGKLNGYQNLPSAGVRMANSTAFTTSQETILWDHIDWLANGMELEYDSTGKIDGIKVKEAGYYLVTVAHRHTTSSSRRYSISIATSMRNDIAIDEGLVESPGTVNSTKTFLGPFSVDERVSVYSRYSCNMDKYTYFQMVKLF